MYYSRRNIQKNDIEYYNKWHQFFFLGKIINNNGNMEFLKPVPFLIENTSEK